MQWYKRIMLAAPVRQTSKVNSNSNETPFDFPSIGAWERESFVVNTSKEHPQIIQVPCLTGKGARGEYGG